MNKKTIIGIDCRLAGPKHAGIGRYIEELVTRVVKDTSIRWVLFFYEADQISLPKQDNIKIVIAPIRHYSFAEQLQMPGVFLQERLSLLHVPHYNVPLFYPGKFVITIHDLLWHTQSNASSTTLSPLTHMFKYLAYKRIVGHATFWATKIIVPTLSVKKEILRHLPYVREKKIIPIYEGVNTKFQILPPQRDPEIGGTNSKFQNNAKAQSSKILFYTGSLYPHKNLMFVVQALRDLPGYQLYISSSRSVFVEEFMTQVKKMKLSDRVHHLGRLSDEALVSWYQKSMALVQPSLSEGFGLTGIEAMSVGLPVLASNIPIFKEVYDNAFIPFDPHSTDSFIHALHNLESMDRESIQVRGQQIAKKY